MQSVVLELIDDWNRVWSTPEEDGKGVNVR